MSASGAPRAPAAGPAPPRQPRRGPAPFASFDHDVSDESSPESKQTFQLPEIREDPVTSSTSAASALTDASEGLAPPEQRARSHSSPAVHAGTCTGNGGLQTPAAPRIDISRASSSSHHDSRDSSPELALFAGGGDDSRGRLELGFREDGALELRSSTEELAFLEGAPGEPRAPAPAPPSRRHSRKDSQGSEAALLGVSGRTSRLSSIGSQCSAQSALSGFSHASRVSRLSVVSGNSRSPSPHKMLLETSFCGPKPIETDPEICAAAVEERLLEMAKMSSEQQLSIATLPANTCDRREVRTEATVETTSTRPPNSARVTTPAPSVTAPTPSSSVEPPTSEHVVVVALTHADSDKQLKETKNKARAEERRARSRERRQPSEPEVYKTRNRSKDIIRIKLKPDDEYDNEEDEDDTSEHTLISGDAVRKPVTLDLNHRSKKATRLTELVGKIEPAPTSPAVSPTPSRRRTPSPAGVTASRKSSFCSLFKSRETITSPDSPSNALRRKKSLNEGRSRSKSRDRSATPTSANKIKGSVLSLFKTPRKSVNSTSPSSRDGSPVVQPQRQFVHQHVQQTKRGEKLKYYENTKDGIIHIPLHTPPDEKPGSSGIRKAEVDAESRSETRIVEVTTHREPVRPASAPHYHPTSDFFERPAARDTSRAPQKPIQRAALPDGIILIPLHSPTEKTVECSLSGTSSSAEPKSETGSDLGVISLEKVEKDAATVKDSDEKTETSSEDARLGEESMSDATSAAPASGTGKGRQKKKERIIFSTHVGSREQVFSTQFSITKTPSVTSEISESFPSFHENEEVRPPLLRDTHITNIEPPPSTEIGIDPPQVDSKNSLEMTERDPSGSRSVTPRDVLRDQERDSSESEPSSEAAPPQNGNDVEQRGLVVQESFEEELPYVPTTLPLERSLALPMVPVRERGDVRVAGVERPRAAAPLPAGPPRPPYPPAETQTPSAEKILIRLPRRPRTASTTTNTMPLRPERSRTRSIGEPVSSEQRPKQEWIDFEEVPERRKQPKRIQTLPAAVASGAGGRETVVFNYVEPEECRCECHARPDDELPLLHDDADTTQEHMRISSTSVECDEQERVQLSVQMTRPFTADLDLHHDTSAHDREPATSASRHQ